MIRIFILGALALATLSAQDVIELKEWKVKPGDDPRWAAPEFDDSEWAPSSWPRRHNTAQQFFAGVRWYRVTVDLPPNFANTGLGIGLPPIDEVFDVFVNGVRIGTYGNWGPPPEGRFPRDLAIPLPEGLSAQGRTTIALRRWTGRTRTNFSVFSGRGVYQVLPPPHIGPVRLVELRAQLRPLHAAQTDEANRIVNLLLFAGALLSLGVFIADPRRKESLWFGLATLCDSAAPFLGSFAVMADLPMRSLLPALCAFLQQASWPLWTLFLSTLCAMPAWLVRFVAVTQLLLVVLHGASYLFQLPYVPLNLLSLLVATGLMVSVAGFVWVRARTAEASAIWLSGSLVFLASTQNLFSQVFGWLGIPERQRYLDIGGQVMDYRNIARLLFVIVALAVLYWKHRREKERQRTIEREMAAAAEIQSMLLMTAEAEGVLAVYQPAAEVGGDFYQVLHRGNGSRFVLVGDVSGKGLKAAMLVSVVVGILRNEKSESPAAILAALNQGLAGHTGGGFVTCCCARFEADGRVTVANAGHPSPYCDGREVALEAGLPLGVVAGVAYEESVVTGQQFTFVSDGVVEAANAKGELFGFDRTREISTKPAQEIAEAAKAWGQNDDITVVTVRQAS